MKTLYLNTLFLCLLSLNSFSQCVDYGEKEHDITGSHGADFLLGQMVNLPTNGIITEISFDAQSSGQQIIVAVYTNNLGFPGTLLTQSVSTSITPGVNTIDVPDVSVNSGQYWIMKVVDNIAVISEKTAIGTNTVYLTLTFGNTLPTVITNTSSYTDDVFTFWVVVCPPCDSPDIPILSYTPVPVCEFSAATISIAGNLKDATAWHVYTGSCNGNLVGTTSFATLNVNPTTTTTYYIRGEGGCIVPSTCNSIMVTVVQNQDASFNYANNIYCTNDADPIPNITGNLGGTFTSLPVGLSINATTGIIDVSASSTGGYSVIYTTAGPCEDVAEVGITINTVDATVSVNNLSITANQNNGFYRWLDCNNNFAPINGATNQTFIAIVNGDYAVEVTANGCVDTSNCIPVKSVGILEAINISDHSFHTYVQNSQINITYKQVQERVDIRIMSLNGQVLYNKSFAQSNYIQIPIYIAPGIYLMEVINHANNIKVVRVYVE